MTQTIGFLAAACTTLAFVPQVIHVWTKRSAADISLAMYLVFIAGVSLWTLYGLRIHSLPVVLANSVTLFLAAAVLVGKLKFDRRRA